MQALPARLGRLPELLAGQGGPEVVARRGNSEFHHNLLRHAKVSLLGGEAIEPGQRMRWRLIHLVGVRIVQALVGVVQEPAAEKIADSPRAGQRFLVARVLMP